MIEWPGLDRAFISSSRPGESSGQAAELLFPHTHHSHKLSGRELRHFPRAGRSWSWPSSCFKSAAHTTYLRANKKIGESSIQFNSLCACVWSQANTSGSNNNEARLIADSALQSIIMAAGELVACASTLQLPMRNLQRCKAATVLTICLSHTTTTTTMTTTTRRNYEGAAVLKSRL